MWPANPRPPSRSSAGDQYNNNTAPTNPYSRTSAVTKTKTGRQSTDPWDWGWEDNGSGKQEDFSNEWNQTSVPAPNVIPNQPLPSSHFHNRQPEKKPHGTPDLIPEQLNNYSRGRGMVQQQYNPVSNASDFFENIDLVGQNHGMSSVPPMYNQSQGQPPQPQNYPFAAQTFPSQNLMNRDPSIPAPASYFHQPSSAPQQNYSVPPQPHPALPQSRSITPQSNSIPPQPNSIPPQPYTAPSQPYTAPTQPYSAPPQPYSTPPQPYSTPPQSHSVPPQSHSLPPQTRSILPQSNSVPPQSHSVPPQPHPATTQPHSLHSQNKESTSYFQPPPSSHTPNTKQNSQFFQPEVTTAEHTNNFYGQNKQNQHHPSYNENKISTQESNNFFDQNKIQAQEHPASYYDHNRPPPSLPYTSYYDQNAFMNNTEAVSKSVTNLSTEEVENVEVAPPERANEVEISRSATENSQDVRRGINLGNAEETNFPDNQETVPDNEEHLQNLPQKISQMKISSSHTLDSWNSSGWENQEVAPRCELDRNQYLETGQLVDSNGPEEEPPEVDNNDEGVALHVKTNFVDF